MFFTVLWLLYDFLSLINDINVPSKSNKQRKRRNKIIFCEGHWHKEQDPEQDPDLQSAVGICRFGSGTGSVPKCQRSTTRVTVEGSDQGTIWNQWTFWHGEQASPGEPGDPIRSSHTADKRGPGTPKGETAEHFPPFRCLIRKIDHKTELKSQ